MSSFRNIQLTDHSIHIVARSIESNIGEIPESFRVFIPKLTSILEGERNPSLADDLALHNIDAAELLFLLERLNSNKPEF